MSLNGSGRSNKHPKKPHTHKELEKQVSDARLVVEELKADLKSIRYEIVNKLIEFTKFGQSLAAETTQQNPTKEREIRIQKLQEHLKITAEEIEKKEIIERETLENYYVKRLDYLEKHQKWRRLLTAAIREQRADGKAIENPQAFSKLIIFPKDESDYEKRMTIDWRGQILSESSISFDMVSGKLGQGAFGAVYRGKCFHTDCAIKVLNAKNLTEANKDEFKAEVITLSNLQHDRILRFLGAVLEEKKMMLVTELCSNGSMADRLFPPIKSKKTDDGSIDDDDDDEDRPRKSTEKLKKKTYYTLAPKKKLSIIRGIIEGMTFLHEHKIVHYDLKPENILLDEEFNPVIADFGLARILSIEDVLGMSSQLGTPFYMAPEMLTTPVQLSPKCDIYAFAFIAWELWVQERNEWKEAITSGGVNTNTLFNIIKKGTRPSFSQRPDKPFPNLLKLLIQACWDSDPNNRPDFKLMQHFSQDPNVMKEAKRFHALKDSLKESSGSTQAKEFRQLQEYITNVNNDFFFSVYNEITSMEVANKGQGWDKLVRTIEKISPNAKVADLDKATIPWEKFVEAYPGTVGLPPFKIDEQILFRLFLIPNDTSEVPKVTKKEFYDPKPNFYFLQELLNIPYFFGLYDSNKMNLAFQNTQLSFLIRQSQTIPAFVLSYKYGPNDPVKSCPLSNETMDSWEALLKFLKDKNAVLRKLNTIQPSKGEKIKWTEVKPAFRPDSLTIALQDLKAYNDLKKNKGKGGEFSTHQNIGMYTTTTNTFNTEEEDQTTKNFVVGNERKLI